MNLSITLTANTEYQSAASTVYITGRTVYGHVVTASTVVNQAAAAGSITVSRMTESEHVDGASGQCEFSITWTGLKTGTTITFATTSGLTAPSPITVTTTTRELPMSVTATRSALSSGNRQLTLTATGTDNNNASHSDSASYTQHGVGGTSGTTLDVVAVTSSPVASNVTSVTFRVDYSNLWGTITLTPSIGTASLASITANGSGNTTVTVTMGANSSHDPRNIKLTAVSDFNNLTRDATIIQAGEGYTPEIWWTKTSGGSSSTSATSINDVPAYVSGTYDGQDVIYTIYINYNSEVSANTVNITTSSLAYNTTASLSGKDVTIVAKPNETTSARNLGSITVNGMAPDGSNASATLAITQVAGVSPELAIDPATQNIAATGTTASARIDYGFIDPMSIASGSTTGNITGVTVTIN